MFPLITIVSVFLLITIKTAQKFSLMGCNTILWHIRHASPSQTILYVRHCCRGTGLRNIPGHFLKMHCTSTGKYSEVLWTNSSHGEQSRGVLRNTTPLSTAEGERCFSTLKRVKSFLGNTRTQEGLNTLPTEKKRPVCEMTAFNQNIIEKVAGLKARREKFMLM